MNFKTLLQDLQDTLGFENLAPDEHGTITLSVNDIFASIAQKDDSVLIVTTLCLLPENPLDLYAFALSKNNMGHSDAHIGVVNSNNTLIMTTKLKFGGLSKSYFLERLNRHFDVAKELLIEINNLHEA